jgi:hypothetical protein
MVPSASASPPRERQRVQSRAWVCDFHFLQLALCTSSSPSGLPQGLAQLAPLPCPSRCTDMPDGRPGWTGLELGLRTAGSVPLRVSLCPSQRQVEYQRRACLFLALASVCGKVFPCAGPPDEAGGALAGALHIARGPTRLFEVWFCSTCTRPSAPSRCTLQTASPLYSRFRQTARGRSNGR